MFIVRFTDRKYGNCYVQNNNSSSISFVSREDATRFKTRKEIEILLQNFNRKYIEEVK